MDRRQFIARAALSGTALALPPGLHAAPAPLDDLTVIREALRLHPGLYRYQSPALFERRFAAFAAQWRRTPGQAGKFLALSRLTAQIQCGHSQCNPYNQTDAVVAALFGRETRVPFTFRWLGGRMVVLGDSGAATGIARGSVVERLNGVAPPKMLAALLPYARADGGNTGKRIAQMEMRATDQYETFDIFQGLLFPPGPDGHRVVWRDPAGKRHEATLPALGLKQRQALVPPEDGDGPIWNWAVRPDGVAVLTMPTWVTYHGKWDWQGWLTERLSSLTTARGLVIDLRDNEGGTDCGDSILERLTDRPLHPLRYVQLVTYRETPPALNPYLDTWDRSFRKIGVGATPWPGGFLRLAEDENSDIAPKSPRVTVPVAALVGPVNSSATFSFARRAKESGLVRLFGETTGGSLRGINGGAYFFVRLPESGLEFDVPLKGNYPEKPQPDDGVEPDVRVVPTPADIAAQRDAAMAKAVEWVLSSPSGPSR